MKPTQNLLSKLSENKQRIAAQILKEIRSSKPKIKIKYYPKKTDKSNTNKKNK